MPKQKTKTFRYSCTRNDETVEILSDSAETWEKLCHASIELMQFPPYGGHDQESVRFLLYSGEQATLGLALCTMGDGSTAVFNCAINTIEDNVVDVLKSAQALVELAYGLCTKRTCI